jgi:CelD/BcsL family acetyltransferase involved in cellulose biosynthesis
VIIGVAHPRELAADELEQWRKIQRDNATVRNPFLSPEFSLAVGEARDTARVAVVRDGGRIVGFFPFEQRSRFVGTAIGFGIADCSALVHEPGFEWDARELIRRCGLRLWKFDHLIADQAPFVPYHAKQSVSPIMDLDEGFDAYLSARTEANSGLMKDLQRRTRKLGREVGDVRFDYHVRDREVLRTLVDWKSAQYRRTGVPDLFAVPWIRETVEHLFTAEAPECAARLSALYAGDQRVALHFGLCSESVFSAWFPVYDPAYGRYSVGRALWLRLAECAATEGLEYVDLGKGRAAYKDELKSRELRIAKGVVDVDRSVAGIRRAARTGRRTLRRVLGRLL